MEKLYFILVLKKIMVMVGSKKVLLKLIFVDFNEGLIFVNEKRIIIEVDKVFLENINIMLDFNYDFFCFLFFVVDLRNILVEKFCLCFGLFILKWFFRFLFGYLVKFVESEIIILI